MAEFPKLLKFRLVRLKIRRVKRNGRQKRQSTFRQMHSAVITEELEIVKI